MDARIPQTAAVNIDEARLEVKYDGEPKFERIENTEMEFAVNTEKSVIKAEGSYYCCEEAVWFVASDPLGPWTVCLSVPHVIYTMPPSAPVYHVKHVYVYDHTPDVVYVGYTPGYVGCYVYGGTVIYGTGYAYPAWHGRYYYPRPVTWGFHVHYNPYTGGWAVGGGRGTPYSRVGVAWGSPGWWGPSRYQPTQIDVNRNINIGEIDVDNSRNLYGNRKDVQVAGREREVGHRRGGTPRGDAAGRAGAKAGLGGGDVRSPAASPGLKNNVFADSDGNIYRRTEAGWQMRVSGGWSSNERSRVSSEPRNRPRSRSDLNRHYHARKKGAQRTEDYRGWASSGSGSSGGRR
jgi:hypothetical protein